MRLHTDKLTYGQIIDATRARGMRGVFASISEHGSRARDHAFEVRLTGTSNRRTNPGTGGGYRDQAATWDEWGIFFAALYELDPNMLAGSAKSPVYADADDFHYQTGDRFRTLTQDDQHKSHTWDFLAYHHFTCKCGATRRSF